MKTGIEFSIRGFVAADFGDPSAVLKASEALAAIKKAADLAAESLPGSVVDEYKTKAANRREESDGAETSSEPAAEPAKGAKGSKSSDKG